MIATGNIRQVIRQGIDYLLEQNNRGYPEAVHYITVPTSQGDGSRIYEAVLFQRMLILDSLLDWEITGGQLEKSMVKKEIAAIILAKHRQVAGGWSYIPSFDPLPPDADDLGMVLQLLARTGGKALAEICDQALEILFDYQINADGSFKTWVLNPGDRSPASIQINYYIEVIGSDTGDACPDVVSNLLWGLILYDKERYCKQITAGIKYLKSAQSAQGFWSSKWYWGNYYATFRAVQVINNFDPESKAIARALDFIVRSQNEDGGWGEKISNPLDTSFALIALSLLTGYVPEKQKGLAYLVQNQAGNGTWNRQPFIRMKTPYGVRTYESRSMTTSFCVQALSRIITSDPNLNNVEIDIGSYNFFGKTGDLEVFSDNDRRWALIRDGVLISRNPLPFADTYLADKPMPSLHIIEMSDRCNQACTYCAASAFDPEAEEKDSFVEVGIDKLAHFITENSSNHFCVEFQGGEALLNFSMIKEVVEKVRRYAQEPVKKPKFRLVSNLTLLNKEIADFLAAENITVSTSLDGPERIHNKNRKLRGGEGSYRKVIDSIGELRKRNIKVGVMTVITKDSLGYPEELVDTFVDLGLNRFLLNPVSQLGFAGNTWDQTGIEPESFGEFWKKVILRAFAYQEKGIAVWDQNLELVIRKVILLQEPNFVDLKSPCGCLHGQIAYDLEGNIYPCDEGRFNQKVILGHINRDTFQEIAESRKISEIIEASVINYSRCGKCPYSPWCGRCPVINKLQFNKYDVPSAQTYKCGIWKGIFNAFFQLLEEKPKSIQRAAAMIRQYDQYACY